MLKREQRPKYRHKRYSNENKTGFEAYLILYIRSSEWISEIKRLREGVQMEQNQTCKKSLMILSRK